METVVRNVGDIDAHDRQALEHVLGHPLRENQQLVIGILDLHGPPVPIPCSANGSAKLPDWCNVYAGLTDADVEELEKTVLRRVDLSRPSE